MYGGQERPNSASSTATPTSRAASIPSPVRWVANETTASLRSGAISHSRPATGAAGEQHLRRRPSRGPVGRRARPGPVGHTPPALRAPNPERRPPGPLLDRRDAENAALIDLTQRRAPTRPLGEQDEKHHGPTTRPYALLGALGTVALMAAIAVTALGGHPAQRRAPFAGAALQTDTERPAATRKVQQASATAQGRSPAHQRVKAHGARTQRSTRSRKRRGASKPAGPRQPTSAQAATQTATAIAQRTPQSANQPAQRAPSTPTRSATSASAALASAANSEFSFER